MNIEALFFLILEHIQGVVYERTKGVLIKPVDWAFDNLEKVIDNYRENREMQSVKIIPDNDIRKIKKYIIDSMGGFDNIVCVKKYQDGYMFVFYDFSKVKYYHMKNFDCRVFISDLRGSMILLPLSSNTKFLNMF